MDWDGRGLAAILDFVDDANTIFIENKNVGILRLTQQIIDTARVATKEGYSYIVYVAGNAEISAYTMGELNKLGITVKRW